MIKVKVVALKNHSPDAARRYRAGDVYELTEKSARFMVALGFVRLADNSPEDTSRRTYKRRDLQAEK